MLVLILISFGCSKDENLKSPEDALDSTEDIMKKAVEKHIGKSLEERSLLIKERYERLKATESRGFLKSGEPEVPLEDVFYLYEAVLNYDQSQFFLDVEDMETSSDIFYVDVFQDSNDDYYIEYEDFVSFYDSLGNHIDIEFGTGEALVAVDLYLVSIDNGIAEIETIMYGGTVNMSSSFYTPGGEVHGAVRAGWCSTSSGSVDAADFLQAYARSQTYFAQNPCPSGQQPWFYLLHDYSTYYSNQIHNPHAWSVNIYGNIWKDNSNSCIGDDNNMNQNNLDWDAWYTKMDYLTNYELAYAQQQNPSLPNIQYFFIDWHSHDRLAPPYNPHWGPDWGSTERYYHGGTILYAECGCL